VVANGYRVSLEGNEMFTNELVMMAVQLCDYTKKQ
jgi:hypothetical protein